MVGFEILMMDAIHERTWLFMNGALDMGLCVWSGPGTALHNLLPNLHCRTFLWSSQTLWQKCLSLHGQGGRRAGGGGVNGGDGGEKENQRDIGGRWGRGGREIRGEKERGGMQPTEGTGEKLWDSQKDRGVSFAGSLLRSNESIRFSSCQSVSLCPCFFFSIFLPLSSVTVSLPAWHCIVAVSAVKVLAGGFSLSEPWLCAVSVYHSAAVPFSLTQLCRKPAGLWVSSSCREQVSMTKLLYLASNHVFFLSALAVLHPGKEMQYAYVGMCIFQFKNVTFTVLPVDL